MLTRDQACDLIDINQRDHELMIKYKTLVNILDNLCLEAPENLKTYHPDVSEPEAQDYARGRAFIHLFLKVRFGLLDFKERESYVTDGADDGGIDAYYIEAESKTVYLIQSKFRTNSGNFESKQIKLEEILKIDADRVSTGETTNEEGVSYNGKIQKMLEAFKDVPDMARYKWQIIILANLTGTKPTDLRKLTGGFSCTVFNFERTYDDLVFPVVSGTFFNVADLFIKLNLTNKELSQSRITYPVTTEQATSNITIIFVPTLEIAKVLHRYKNSVLRFNPRSYLDLKTNPVNREIAGTITEKKSNEFALFNNGITILSDETDLSEKIGQKETGQLYIKNPQIINGGQTAYTLCRIFEERRESEQRLSVFQDKEVMLKVITLPPGQTDNDRKLQLIEAISKATNQQTAVSEADRRSNDKVQIELQKNIFSTFGYFYERKRGEFLDGLEQGYIDNGKIISRNLVLRVSCALKGRASEARRQSEKKLFEKSSFDTLLDDSTDYRGIMFGILCLEHLNSLERNLALSTQDRYGTAKYGYGLRYGKYAIVTAVCKTRPPSSPINEFEGSVKAETEKVLSKWTQFESQVMREPHNSAYFWRTKDPETGEETAFADFDGYYKGRTANQDLRSFKFVPTL